LYHKRTSPAIFHRARENRHDLTPAKTKLWAHLRAHRFADVHFRHQHAIGQYIVDFCAPARKLIIEVDDSPHLDQKENETERTAHLAAEGYRVLRIWSSDVMNKINEVMGIILEEMGELINGNGSKKWKPTGK
jgi:very-short-patch-repair endonuclease